MSYRYLALIDMTVPPTPPAAASVQLLRAHNMPLRFASAPITLFASDDTPVLQVPDGGTIIGHLFSRNGTKVADGTQLKDTSAGARFRKSLLANYWGEYILLQPRENRGLSFLRDPSGGVPCIYSLKDGRGFITSDIALAVETDLCSKKVNWEHIHHVLTYPHLKSEQTGLVDILELLPGCTRIIQGSASTSIHEWTPWDFVAPSCRHTDYREAESAVQQVVTSNVRSWAETDESILLELSGGLDSSIIAACLTGTDSSLSCCTLVPSVPGADERQYAAIVADRLGLQLHVENLTFEAARYDFMPPPHLVTPAITPLQYATNGVMEAACNRQGATSFFSGGGGDTVFGYLKTAAPAADAFKELGLAAGVAALRDLSELHQCTVWKAARLTLKKLLRTPSSTWKADTSLLSPSITSPPAYVHPWSAAPINALPGDRERIADLIGTQAFRDGLPRGAKRWFRMPLLSQPVIEACLRVPSWMWISGGINRAIARTAFADALPRQIIERRSKGTFASYSGAIYRRDSNRMRDFLLNGKMQSNNLLDTDALRRHFERELPARDQSFLRIFHLCMVENWLRHQP